MSGHRPEHAYTAQQQATLRKAHDMVTIYNTRLVQDRPSSLDRSHNVQRIASMLALLDPHHAFHSGTSTALQTHEATNVRYFNQSTSAVRRELDKMVAAMGSSGFGPAAGQEQGHGQGQEQDATSAVNGDCLCIGCCVACIFAVISVLCLAWACSQMYQRREDARNRNDRYSGWD